jgi:hypothetical protein
VEALMEDRRDTPEVEIRRDENRFLSSYPYCKLPVDFFDLMLARGVHSEDNPRKETKIIEIRPKGINLPGC